VKVHFTKAKGKDNYKVDEKLSNEKGQSLQHLLKVKSPQNLRKRK